MLLVIVLIILLEIFILGYFGNIGPLKFLNENRIKKHPGNNSIYDFSNIEYVEDKRLNNKTLCILGSSVSRGEKSLDNSIGEYFKYKYHCNLIKETVSGTTLAGKKNNTYINRMINNIKEKHIDIFVCQLSTNDILKTKQFGEISNNDDFNIEEITGAIEYIITYVKNNWDCPLFFYTNSYFKNDKYALMVKQLYKLKDKYDIEIIDLYNDEDFNNKYNDLYMFDMIHPTMAGYRLWWCPEIEKQILNKL